MNPRKIFGLVGILAALSPVATNSFSFASTTYYVCRYENSGDGVQAAQEIHGQKIKDDNPLSKTLHTIFYKQGEDLAYRLYSH